MSEFFATKPFTVKIGNKVTSLNPGDIIELPENKAKKLLIAGVIQPAVLDKLQGKVSCQCDVTGCWCSAKLPTGATECRNCEPRNISAMGTVE